MATSHKTVNYGFEIIDYDDDVLPDKSNYNFNYLDTLLKQVETNITASARAYTDNLYDMVQEYIGIATDNYLGFWYELT